VAASSAGADSIGQCPVGRSKRRHGGWLRNARVGTPASSKARKSLQTITTRSISGPGSPDNFDPVSHLTTSLAQTPYPWQVEVLINGPIDEIARRLPRTVAILTPPQPTGVLMHARVQRLDGVAHLLASLEWPFTIHSPDELRQALKDLAHQLATAAARRPQETPQ